MSRMFKGVMAHSALGPVVGMDSITQAGPEDAACVVITGSHGGRSSGEFALLQPLKCVIFNDAGIGRDEAGVAALAHLQEQAQARAAATVAHTSGRIGDAQDMWRHGVLSRVNAAAFALGARPGRALKDWLQDNKDET